MNARMRAIAIACVAIAIVLAQDVRPGLDAYHTWQYAAALAVAMLVMVAYAWNARRGTDGAAGKRVALAMVGALAVSASGLLAGLIGPDTIAVSGAPGTVVPVPDLGAAAFFGQADAAAIARGDGTVSVRKPGAREIAVAAGSRAYVGTSIAYLGSRPAAYVVARDRSGNRLTVTQPANPTFLSPVLLFPNVQPIRDKRYPLDTFATPATHRIVRALYFDAAEAAAFSHPGTRGPALVLSVNDDAGRTVGLTVASSGRDVSVGGIRVTATLGTYPQLMVAAAPHPAVLVAGVLLFAAGLAAAASTARRTRIENVRISPTA